MTREEAVRRNKAKNLRYKKAMVNNLSIWQIRNSIEEMGEECNDVAYWTGGDLETLVDALDGECDDAQQFLFDFAQLSTDLDRMWEDMNSIEDPERFDDIMVVSGIGNKPGYEMLGYDVVEEDYFGINPYESGWAESESMKRLERLTKKQLMQQMAQTLSIVFAYIGLQSRYQDLKAAMDILRAKNKEYLDGVKRINEIYDSIHWEDRYVEYSKEIEALNAIIEILPQEAFL